MSDPWRPWLDEHGPALVLFAAQWTATRAEAEDALQIGFLRFWQTRARARDPLAYLYACVRSAALDLHRARVRRQAREAAAAKPEALFEAPAPLEDRRSAIEDALQKLPAGQREVVVMKTWGNLTFAQIAAALEISPHTAASRYRYALEKLESLLAREAQP